MQRNECKPGTEVIIRGKIKEDDGTDLHPIIVDIHGSKREEIRCLDPSQLEPARTKYDPARKYRKGDLVRFIHRGRRNYLVTPENGEECTIIENEKQEQVLIKCCGYTAVFHFADLELVKPVEEIEVEQPYSIKDVGSCVQVKKGGNYIYKIFWKSNTCPKSPYSKEEALRKAQELCDELNREPLNA